MYQQTRKKDEDLLIACFQAWAEMRRDVEAKQIFLRRILCHHWKQQQKKYFNKMKQNVQCFQLQMQMKNHQARNEHQLVKVAQEYKLKLHQIQHELNEARQQIIDSQKYRQKHEEDLRLIFLRGVSAMNIEALTVFGSSHKQGQQLNEVERRISPLCPHEPQINQDASANDSPLNNSEDCEDTNPPKTAATTTPEVVSLDTFHSSLPTSHVKTPSLGATPPPHHIDENITWPQSSIAPSFRSAEMIRQHGLSKSTEYPLTSGSTPPHRPMPAELPTSKRTGPQSSVKYQVEMQYVRSIVSVPSAKTSGYARPTRSSANSRRSLAHQ